MKEAEIRQTFFRVFRHDQMRAAEASRACDEVFSGLATMLRLGYTYELQLPSAWVPDEWPRMYYHQTFGQQIVHSQAEADALGPGWGTQIPQEYVPPRALEAGRG